MMRAPSRQFLTVVFMQWPIQEVPKSLAGCVVKNVSDRQGGAGLVVVLHCVVHQTLGLLAVENTLLWVELKVNLGADVASNSIPVQGLEVQGSGRAGIDEEQATEYIERM